MRGKKIDLNLYVHQEILLGSVLAFLRAYVVLCKKWLNYHWQFTVTWGLSTLFSIAYDLVKNHESYFTSILSFILSRNVNKAQESLWMTSRVIFPAINLEVDQASVLHATYSKSSISVLTATIRLISFWKKSVLA